jgi:inner membrane protein
MTTYEHMMVGITGSLTAGVHRKYGWSIIFMAGVVAMTPDWDGLTILFSTQAFAEGHRVWGHNVFACISGLIMGLLDYRFDYSTRFANQLLKTRIGRWFQSEIYNLSSSNDETINESQKITSLPLRKERTSQGFLIWGCVGFLAIFSHLIADLVVSGTDQLADWKLKLFWPISEEGYVYPLIKWGDPGMTILFVIGMLAACKWPSKIQQIASATLSAVVVYIIL